MTTVSYELRPRDPRTHIFDVLCRIDEPDNSGQVLSLPAWIPGSYLVRDFAKHLSMGTVRDSSRRPVECQRLDKQTWRCMPTDGPIEVEYQVYARDPSVRAAYLDTSRGFVNATSVFLRVHGQEKEALTVGVAHPEGGEYPDWQVSTPLRAVDVDARGWGQYKAGSYAELVDSPILMADYDRLDYSVNDVNHSMLLAGEHDADKARLAGDLARICSVHARTMGQLPADRYDFITFVVSRGYGGLEHRNCSVLQVARDSLPPARGEPSDGYMDFLGLCSHEYFHLWNVKRIRPEAVATSDLDTEAHFEDLWAYEGVTSYYDELALVRADLLEPAAYLKRLGDAATRMQRNPGRQHQSLVDSSFDAWTKFYKQDENTINSVVSYYNKGSFVALCLDLRLRLLGQSPGSLDEVMRQLWQRFGSRDRPVPDHGLETLVMNSLDNQGQASLAPFFDRFVRSTDDMTNELISLLAEFGVTATLEQDSSDAGIYSWIGLRVAPGSSEARLASVLRDSPAERAGLSPEDVIIAVDGRRVSVSTVARELRRSSMNGAFDLHVFRDGYLQSYRCDPGEQPADKWRMEISSEASDQAQARRLQWLDAPA